jgi:hypothetical protein
MFVLNVYRRTEEMTEEQMLEEAIRQSLMDAQPPRGPEDLD